jgi:hypothetical protein
LTHLWVWTGLAALLAGAALFGLGIAGYPGHVQASAKALIQSARVIRTTADAEREIAAWRRRSGNDFWVESREGSEKTYEGQVVNGIARLGLVVLTEVTVDVTMHDGNLRRITVTEWTAWYPLASVWIEEWFDACLGGLPNRLLVSRTGKPSVAAVVFPSSLRDDQRRKAFAFNTKCLVQPSLCKTAEDILPGVWQLDSDAGPNAVQVESSQTGYPTTRPCESTVCAGPLRLL